VALTPVPASPFVSGTSSLFSLYHPLIPFGSSFVTLKIRPGHFDLNESFTLGKDSNGINPGTEKVTRQMGTFSVTIPRTRSNKIPTEDLPLKKA